MSFYQTVGAYFSRYNEGTHWWNNFALQDAGDSKIWEWSLTLLPGFKSVYAEVTNFCNVPQWRMGEQKHHIFMCVGVRQNTKHFK